jgi:hypothetical protein
MAMRAVKPFAAIYSEAQGTNDEKLHAVAAEFDRMRAATMDATEISRAFGVAMGSNASRVQLANNKLDELAGQMTETLLPAVAGLAPALAALIPVAGGMLEKFAKLLGINPTEDEDARRRRRQQDLVNAADKELTNAENTPMRLLPGPHGAEMSLGKVDQAHEQALAGQGKDLTTELEKKQKEYEAHAAELEKNGFVGDYDQRRNIDNIPEFMDGKHLTIPERGKIEDSRILAGEKSQVDALRQLQQKTIEVLQNIHKAVSSGRAQYSRAPSSSTMPAESEGPDG